MYITFNYYPKRNFVPPWLTSLILLSHSLKWKQSPLFWKT